MKYCKNCGAELAEGAAFCEKCGNPVGQMPKQGNGKKKWVIGIGSGVIILAAAIVGVLFAMDLIGGKDKVVQTNTDTVDVQQTSDVTGEAVGSTEESERSKQKDTSENSNLKNQAWEAYVAYKAYLKGQKNVGELEDGNEDEEYIEQSQYSLIYLDEDNYPELIVFHSMQTVENHFLYTYKNGEVFFTEFTATEIYYKERKGYIFDYSRHTIGTTWDFVAVLKGINTESVYNNSYEAEMNKSVEDSNYNLEEHFDSPDKVADQCGITGGWDEPVYGENIDETYTQFLSLGNR